jgi:hypothetical protein
METGAAGIRGGLRKMRRVPSGATVRLKAVYRQFHRDHWLSLQPYVYGWNGKFKH